MSERRRRWSVLALGPLALLPERPIWALVLVALALFLTLLTQIGGVTFWVSFSLVHLFVGEDQRLGCLRYLAVQATAALLLYGAVSLFAVPPLAAAFGRVPVPCVPQSGSPPLVERSFLYCALNRHYVRPALRDLLQSVAVKVSQRFPGSTLHVLDASFPFFDGFPLLPHLSHHDGRKVDLAFFYRDKGTGQPAASPSPVGYWAYTQPRQQEPRPCEDHGSPLPWDFDWLQPFFDKETFDAERTGYLIEMLVREAAVQRVLLEPHLRVRMGLPADKVRFQGCQAARHDDHLHLQVAQ